MLQEDSEQTEVDGMKKGADSTGEMMHSLSKRAVGDLLYLTHVWRSKVGPAVQPVLSCPAKRVPVFQAEIRTTDKKTLLLRRTPAMAAASKPNPEYTQ